MWDLAAAVLGVTGFSGLTLWRAAAREKAAEAAHPPRGTFVTVQGVRMHAVVEGQGPDLVLIHGLSGSVNDFTFALLPALASRYRVIAVDRPGKGWSQPVEDGWRLERQARLIRDVAAHFGAERPLVLGHSYGGAVGLAWAVHFPDNLAALVPVSAPSHVHPDHLGWYYFITSHPLLRPVAIPLLAAWLGETRMAAAIDDVFAPQKAPTDYASHFGPAMTIRRAAMRVNSACRRHLKREIAALQPRYGDISVPVEIVHGAADPVVVSDLHAQLLAQDVPGARLKLLPGIGHMPHHVAIPAVAAAVDRAAARAGLQRDEKSPY